MVVETLRYAAHLEWRLRIRRVARQLPARVYRKAEERFSDTVTGHEIAIARLPYRGKVREVMVAYDRVSEGVELVTIHPLRPEQKQSRVHSGRWKRI